jgi:purine-binding chemotaxis protein CheW
MTDSLNASNNEGAGSVEGEDEGGVGNPDQYVTFAVAGEMFAVPIAPVQEIIRMPAVSQLPLAPAALDGLANLRGRVLPIINLRRLFGCPPQDADDATRALVIQIGQPLGFVVDRVASVVTIKATDIEPADAIQSIVSADYLTGVIKQAATDGTAGTELLMLIDFARLIKGQFSGIGARVGAPSLDPLRLGASADEAVGDELRLVSFSVADQEYALHIAEVQEIVQLPEQVSALPHSAGHVLGLISLRQRLLPLVSLRALFALPALAYSEAQRIVVASLPGGLSVGLVCDAVKEVLSVARAQVDALPGVLAADARLQEFSAICRLEGGKRLVSVLSTEQLLALPAVAAAVDASERTAVNSDQIGDASADALDDDLQLVIFRLGAEEFGVPITSVQEIVRVPEVLTRVPRTPDSVEGVINLRGAVLPVIDQRRRLGLPQIARNEGQRIMVYLLAGRRTGFIVDSVAQVLRVPLTQIVPAPALSEAQGRLIARVAKIDGDRRLVLLIEPDHLLQGEELEGVGACAA